MSLDTTTLELWPNHSRLLIKRHGLSVKQLQKTFTNIIFPWDDNYDQQRMLFSTQLQLRPIVIIAAVNEDEIIKLLNMLEKYNLNLRIIGGRHSQALQDPDIFLDMSLFNHIVVDKYITVGSGLSQGQINSYLFENHKELHFVGIKPNHPNSTAFPGGSASTVGIAGITGVGGIGVLRRTLGLTIDSVKSFRIVAPPTNDEKAKVIIASKKENDDLFFALLGGNAANFGILIEITFYSHKINQVILYEISWDYDKAERVLTEWQNTSPRRNNSFNEDLAIFNIGADKFIHLTGVYVIPDDQSDSRAKKTIMRECESLGGILIINDPTDYSDVYEKFVQGRVYHSYSIGKTILTKKNITAQKMIDALDIFVSPHGGMPKGNAYLGLQLMGGKISDVCSCETAFYPRDAKFFVDIFSFWDSNTQETDNMVWNDETFNTLYNEAGPYVYLGFPIFDLPLRAYYGKNLERLKKIKAKIDPKNLLVFPGSIKN